jgi:RimJ/RimL family protein N-acetyltransferase
MFAHRHGETTEVSVLETPRLRLHLLHEENDEDAALYVHLYTDAEVMQHIAARLTGEQAARGFARACRHNRASRPGHRTWRIDERASGADLGIVALQRAGEAAEIGVMLRPCGRGNGLAREALAAVLEHAFGALGLALIYGERPDDGQARLVDRMFAPLGLERVPGRTPVTARWELARTRWIAARG